MVAFLLKFTIMSNKAMKCPHMITNTRTPFDTKSSGTEQSAFMLCSWSSALSRIAISSKFKYKKENEIYHLAMFFSENYPLETYLMIQKILAFYSLAWSITSFWQAMVYLLSAWQMISGWPMALAHCHEWVRYSLDYLVI